MKATIETEGFYTETPNGIYYYWRVVGQKEWNKHLTGMKELPYVEFFAPKTTINKEG